MNEEALYASDSTELYEPGGFDGPFELKRAGRLAKLIEARTGLRTEVDDPSGFQDGSLFTRLLLFAPDGTLPGQVLLSSFGSLVTVFEMADDALEADVAVVAGEQGYAYVDSASLQRDYDGRFGAFNGLSWLDRYFSVFYRRHAMLRRRSKRLEQT